VSPFKFGFQAAFGVLAAVLVLVAAWWVSRFLFAVWVTGGGDVLKVVLFWGWLALSIVCGSVYWLVNFIRRPRSRASE
jgi:hypothetical protein